MAFDFAKKLGKDINDWEEAKVVGKDWLLAILCCIPALFLWWSPEATSIARATAFNRAVANASLRHTSHCCTNTAFWLVMYEF